MQDTIICKRCGRRMIPVQANFWSWGASTICPFCNAGSKIVVPKTAEQIAAAQIASEKRMSRENRLVIIGAIAIIVVIILNRLFGS